MGKIETTFIRPKELYTPETGETKVVYDGYQNNPHELVVEENLEGEVSEIVNDTFVPNEGGNVVFTDNNETEHELITEDGFAGALDTAMPTALAKAQVIETTWQELKDKRDNGQLIAGSLYRITDYQCTTTQENTQSAGHQFDIVLLALSANKLAEEGWAMMHDNIYDVTFSDGVTKKCYAYFYTNDGDNYANVVDCVTMLGTSSQYEEGEIEINEQNKTMTYPNDSFVLTAEYLPYNYFQNSKLEAWKVWYCLDNDTSRFAWADDSVDEDSPAMVNDLPRYPDGDQEINNVQYYCWGSELGVTTFNRFTTSETPDVGDDLYAEGKGGMTFDTTITSYTPAHEGTGLPNGRGVIYRLIDEFMNDVGYDFKNIQFVRKLTNGEYDDSTGTDTWVYTFNGWDADNSVIIDNSLAFDGANNNFIGVTYTNSFALPNVVYLNYAYCSSSSGSSVSTIIGSNNRLEGCEDLVVVADNSTFIYCDNDTIGDGTQDPAIYINNKKVLTEE